MTITITLDAEQEITSLVVDPQVTNAETVRALSQAIMWVEEDTIAAQDLSKASEWARMNYPIEKEPWEEKL